MKAVVIVPLEDMQRLLQAGEETIKFLRRERVDLQKFDDSYHKTLDRHFDKTAHRLSSAIIGVRLGVREV